MRLLSSISMVSCLGVQAQVNFPFPDSAAIWVQYFEMMVTPPPMPQFEWTSSSNICLSGEDTLVGGNTYKEVERCDEGYAGALREDSGQVFFLTADSVQEHLLYDFNVLLGDTLHNVFTDEGLAFGGGSYPDLMDLVVTQLGPEVDGRKVIYLSSFGGFSPSQIWIEGFGARYGLFCKQDPSNVSGYWYGIACMSYRDTMWSYDPGGAYSNPGTCTPQYVGYPEPVSESMCVQPNPTSGWVSIGSALQPRDAVVLTDAQGRVIDVPIRTDWGALQLDLSHLPDGLYFLTLGCPQVRSTHRILKAGGIE